MKPENVYRIMKPIARLFLRLGLNFNDVVKEFTRAYIDQASDLIGKKEATHISAKTGIDRRTISRLKKEERVFTPPDRLVMIQADIRQMSKEGQILVPIKGPDSVETALTSCANGRLTLPSVVAELERSGRIEVIDDHVKYLRPVSDGGITDPDKLAQLLEDSLDIIGNVAPYSRSHNENKLIYRWDYSEQIHPQDAVKASNALFEQCERHSKENIELLTSFETTRFWSHPRVGVMQAQFNYDSFSKVKP